MASAADALARFEREAAPPGGGRTQAAPRRAAMPAAPDGPAS